MSHAQQILTINACAQRIPDIGPVSDRARLILAGIGEECSNIFELMTHPNIEHSQIKIDMVLNQEKINLRRKIDAAATELIPSVERWRVAQEAARVAQADLKPDAFAQETRMVFRTMGFPEKLAFVSAATDAGDGKTMAAILSCPPILSGLTEAQQTQFRDAFLDRVADSSDDTANEVLACIQTALSAAAIVGKPVGAAPAPTSASGSTV